MPELKHGVGYVMPMGERTRSGHLIPRGWTVPADNDPDIAAKMATGLGDDWGRGRPGSGAWHTTDIESGLRTMHERAARGIPSGGFLDNEGAGYDGNPTDTEILLAHRGVIGSAAVMAAVTRSLPGEDGHWATPLNPGPFAGWSTEMWRASATEGRLRHNAAKILEQVQRIENGEIGGWHSSPTGWWRGEAKDPQADETVGERSPTEKSDLRRFAENAVHHARVLLDEIERRGL